MDLLAGNPVPQPHRWQKLRLERDEITCLFWGPRTSFHVANELSGFVHHIVNLSAYGCLCLHLNMLQVIRKQQSNVMGHDRQDAGGLRSCWPL